MIVTANDVLTAAPDGAMSKIPYPAGEYKESEVYVSTAYTTPYVMQDGEYYILNKDSAQGIDPKTDYAAHGNDATWIHLDKFAVMYVEMLIANLGKIGAAIFYQQYMFSQHGTVDGKETSEYGVPTDAGGDFSPNLLIDFLNGILKCNNADIKGNIEATSGKFGNLKIADNRLEGDNGYLHFGPSGDNYTYVSTTDDEIRKNANIYISNATSSYGIYVTAANGRCLRLLGKTAIEAEGSFSFKHETENNAYRTWITSGANYLDIRVGKIVFRFMGNNQGTYSIAVYHVHSEGPPLSLMPIGVIASGKCNED